MVLSNNKMIYDFDPDMEMFEWFGGEIKLASQTSSGFSL